MYYRIRVLYYKSRVRASIDYSGNNGPRLQVRLVYHVQTTTEQTLKNITARTYYAVLLNKYTCTRS